MVKAVSLFLIALLVLAMFGRMRFPGQNRLKAMRCPTCGRYRIGAGRCDCAKPK